LTEGIIPEGIEEEGRESARLSSDLAAALALRQAQHDPAGRAAATAFLVSHKRFVDLQIAYFREEKKLNERAARLKRISDLLRVLMQFAFVVIALAVGASLAAMVWGAISSRAVIVREFAAPRALADLGLVGRVVSGKVLDVLLEIQGATRVAAEQHQITDAWTDTIELQLPETGVSFQQIDDGLHRLFGHDIHIEGALVRSDDGSLALSVRGDGIVPKTFQGSDVDKLARQAGEYVFGWSEPALYVEYLSKTGRAQDGIAFLEQTFPRVTDAERPELAYLWGDLFLMQGDTAKAAERYRLALDIDPYSWGAWNRLISVLPDTENEEAAYHAGLAMQEAARSGKAAKAPSLFDQVNFAELTIDPGAVIAGVLEYRQLASREGEEFDDSSWIAEQEAIRHDWPAVTRYLAESPRDDVTTSFDQQALAGLLARERNDAAAAIVSFEAADKLWQASPTLQAYFSDFPCNLASAYAATGRFAEAAPIFARGVRFVRCRALAADALDLQGKWPEAQAAYRAAEAVAPDLAYAYEREGAALLRHGDAAGAIARLQIAQRLSPHWADPLKTWGDALGAEGQWSAAAAKYDEALRWAPNWVALKEAKAAASAKLAKASPGG
jgi:tetratricopeptide (TPR) repeat protein